MPKPLPVLGTLPSFMGVCSTASIDLFEMWFNTAFANLYSQLVEPEVRVWGLPTSASLRREALQHLASLSMARAFSVCLGLFTQEIQKITKAHTTTMLEGNAAGNHSFASVWSVAEEVLADCEKLSKRGSTNTYLGFAIASQTQGKT